MKRFPFSNDINDIKTLKKTKDTKKQKTFIFVACQRLRYEIHENIWNLILKNILGKLHTKPKWVNLTLNTKVVPSFWTQQEG